MILNLVSEDEDEVITWMNKILVGSMENDMRTGEKIAVAILWIFLLIIPVFLFISRSFTIRSMF